MNVSCSALVSHQAYPRISQTDRLRFWAGLARTPATSDRPLVTSDHTLATINHRLVISDHGRVISDRPFKLNQPPQVGFSNPGIDFQHTQLSRTLNELDVLNAIG